MKLKASVMKLPKKRDYVKKEMHATNKKLLHAGVQNTPGHTADTAINYAI